MPMCHRFVPFCMSSSLNYQTKKSFLIAPAPITAVVKTVTAQISGANPTWDVNERRVAKFVKKEINTGTTSSSTAAGRTMTDAKPDTMKVGKFKFTSPIAKLKKKKAAKEELLKSAIKEAAPNGGDPVSPVKMTAVDVVTPVKEVAAEAVDAAKETVEMAKDAYKDEKEKDSEPCCSACVIC